MVEAVPLKDAFWIWVVIHFVIHSGISVFYLHLFISIASLSCIVMNFKTNIYVCHLGQGFERSLESIGVYIHLGAFFEHLPLCFHAVYSFDFCLMIFAFPYIAVKSFCNSRIQLLIWLHPFSPYLLVEGFSLFWNVMFCLFLVLCQFIFSLLFSLVFFEVSSRIFFWVLLAVLFQFRLNISSCSVLVFFLVVRVFYMRFKFEFTPGFWLSFCGRQGYPDFFTG